MMPHADIPRPPDFFSGGEGAETRKEKLLFQRNISCHGQLKSPSLLL